LMLLHAGLHLAFIARAYLFDTGYDRIRESALLGLLSLPFLTHEVRAVYLTARGSGLASVSRMIFELVVLVVVGGGLVLIRRRADLLMRIESALIARRATLLNVICAGLLLISAYAYLVRPVILDADMFFNTRGGWSDPLTRNPAVVARDVREGRMTLDEARLSAGVVMQADTPYWFAAPDLAATTDLRARLAQERGPWAGPFSNQTLNWLRLQGYIGAPIHLPVHLWYNEYKTMNWWQRLTIDPSTLPSEPKPDQAKYTIPLANMVRMGWYLSPLGVVLGVLGFTLWLRRSLSPASWLFFAVAFLGTFFFVRQTYGTSIQHYIYILRRFVPIAYPAFSLGMAYAIVALAQRTVGEKQEAKGRRFWGLGSRISGFLSPTICLGLSIGFTVLLIAFFVVTNQPIYRHVEYAGALEQLKVVADQFTPGRDVLLMRGGGAIYSDARDVPDMVTTPLSFIYGLNALTVKSNRPGAYAADLAAEVAHWQSAGRQVYLVLSASGASFALPGYQLEPVGGFTLDLPEFEQLTDQKPRNVAQLKLPFQIYRALPATPGVLGTLKMPIAPDDFASQVSGFHWPEIRTDGSRYAWTNGDALLRLAWPTGSTPETIKLNLAAGKRPDHLGAAAVCFSAQPEQGVWPEVSGTVVDLGCVTVASKPAEYTVQLDPAVLPPTPSGTLLLRITNQAWIPAAEDPAQTDQRSVGVQFGGVKK
ncbi:MAG: hypothetical protein HGA19_11050, partial [Oscillochloris sp.]|nr:hypothetical protein [Oscillochloris sp.]